jgi:RHS repeat-associated protein
MKTMKTHILTLALAAIFGNTAFAAFPAAMPEFKNEKQLATWRAEQASKADTRTAEETHAFYTGKPYLGSTGSYAFLYRSYNPELARWTSEDPSGFPDGANGSIYAPVPTIGLDALGLFYSGTAYSRVLTDMAAWEAMKAAGGTLTSDAMNHADGTTPGNWTLSTAEDSLVKGCADYTGNYYPSVQKILGKSPADGPMSTPVNHLLFTKPSDEYYAFGHADLSTSGTVTRPAGKWQYDATVTLADTYSFAGYAGASFYTPTALGYRLESHGYLKAFTTSGTWTDTWYE